MDNAKVILAIDDNPQQLENFEVSLGSEYDLRTSKSAAEALSFLAKNAVDMILLDIEMPEINGFEFLGDIRQLLPSTEKTPIIIVSGNSGEEFMKQAKQSTAAAVLGKPVKKEDLKNTIEKVFSGRA